MSITHVGNLGHANDKTSGSTVATTVTAASVGDEIVVLIAFDNNNGATITGPEALRGSVSDSRGNTYEELADAEDSSTDNRAYGAIYKSRLTTALQNGDTVTYTYVSSRVASAITVERFTSNRPLRRFKPVHLHSRAVAGMPSITLDLEHDMDGKQVLWLHAAAIESDTAGITYSEDTNFTEITGDGTTGSTDATNMSIRGGYRITTGSSSVTNDADISGATTRDMTQLLCALVEVADTLSLPSLTPGTGFQYLQCVGWASTLGQGTAAADLAGLLDGCPVGTYVTVIIGWSAVNDITDTGPNDLTQQFTLADTAGNTWVQLGATQNANGAAEAGTFCAIFGTSVTSAISPGDTLTVTQPNENKINRHWTAHAFAAEGEVGVVGRAHTLTDSADPGAVTLSSLTSSGLPYLFLHGLVGNGYDSDEYTWDSDYTRMVGYGGRETSATVTGIKHVRSGYRIATLTGDTVDVTSTTADRIYAQLLLALGSVQAQHIADSVSLSDSVTTQHIVGFRQQVMMI